MTSMSRHMCPPSVRRAQELRVPAKLDRRFEAVVFDWYGTAVPDRRADADELRVLVELCALGLDLVVITDTQVGIVDRQLGARPRGPGRLYFCVNGGSEVYGVNPDGIELLYRCQATPDEESALDAAAAATVAELSRRGLGAEVVSHRPNRRKIDLIPEPTWADPPKAQIAELLAAVQERLRAAGLAGLGGAVEIALTASRSTGLDDPRAQAMTSTSRSASPTRPIPHAGRFPSSRVAASDRVSCSSLATSSARSEGSRGATPSCSSPRLHARRRCRSEPSRTARRRRW
jgi:hypothetical protein